MITTPTPQCFQAIVIGGGQAGLAIGYRAKYGGSPYLTPTIGNARDQRRCE